ncbi:MAG TPA: DUF3301 domain-containing protein [Burkholderiales bacterium]|jgi:hypothetical protein
MLELFVLAIFVLSGWFWMDTLQARDAALDAARRACEAENVQLLDWTVAVRKLGLGRDEDGRRRIRRTYEFEFSDTGNNRIKGSLTLIGRHLLALNLPLLSPPPSAVIRLH